MKGKVAFLWRNTGREEPGGSRQRESLEGAFWKAAGLASCREAVRHSSPDGLAGQSHTARKGWPGTGDTPGGAGRGGKEDGGNILRQWVPSSLPTTPEQVESQRGSVRGPESKPFGGFSPVLQPRGALALRVKLKLSPTHGHAPTAAGMWPVSLIECML